MAAWDGRLEILIQLLLLLVVARALGEAAERLGQPASVGELIAGIVLAAAIAGFGAEIPLLARLKSSDVVEHVAQLGIFFVVLMAGIEMKPREIAGHPLDSLAVACGGMVVPLAGGFALAWAFLPAGEIKLVQALLVGVALSITAIPVTVRVLAEFGVLHTRLGQTVVAAAIFDDILGLFLFAVLTAMMVEGTVPDLLTLALMLGKVALFFAITVSLGVHVYPRISETIKTFQAAATEFGILMMVALAYALLAEALGLHWILGAFLAGLFFEPARVGGRAYDDMKMVVGGIAGGFLAPLFFVSIGLRVDLGVVAAIPGFLALLVAVAFFAKLIGAGVPALLIGLGRRDSLATGVGMTARGAVELVILSIAYKAGLFAQPDNGDPVVAHLFSALVLMAVVTTLLAPIVLRAILVRNPPPP